IGIENFLRTLHEGGRLRGKQKTKLRRVAYGAMRRVARSLGRPVGDPTGRYHRQIRESFLAAWSDHAMRGKIVRDFPLIEEAFPLLMTVEWWRTKNQLANPWEAEANLIQ